LTNHPKVQVAAIRAIEKSGTGCAGSWFLNGTPDIHIKPDKKLAQLVNKDEANGG
jgi:8-amino-7-oxononanoate synthase